MKKIETEKRIQIWNFYKKTKNKKLTAEKFNCSVRTVGRIIVENGGNQSKSKFHYIITPLNIVLTKNNNSRTINKNNKNFKIVEDNIRKKEFETAWTNMNIPSIIEKNTDGKIIYKDGKIFMDNKELKGSLVDRIVDGILNKDYNVIKYKNFLEKANKNPNLESIEGLYRFLEANCIEINSSGNFLGFKVVTKDYKDIYTETIDNSLGKTIKMDRKTINTDSNVTCSQGLHICSSSYVHCYGKIRTNHDKVLMCEVNPMNVCAVPKDYNNAKMRCCEYTVIEDVTDIFK